MNLRHSMRQKAAKALRNFGGSSDTTRGTWVIVFRWKACQHWIRRASTPWHLAKNSVISQARRSGVPEIPRFVDFRRNDDRILLNESLGVKHLDPELGCAGRNRIALLFIAI